MNNDALGSNAKSHTILLVDDESMVLEVGKAILEMLGHRVIDTMSGEEALQKFSQHQQEIDCVVLDLTMPGMDGREIYARLREISPGIPIIISSGLAVEQVIAEFGGSGITPASVIQKPYQIADLSNKIQGLL